MWTPTLRKSEFSKGDNLTVFGAATEPIPVSPKRATEVLIVLTIMVIAMGGMIRIYDAGESCPDWPTCFGTFGFDISEEEQGEWWDENPDEADSRGSGHRYTTFEIFTEWFHRLLAGAFVGPLVILNWFLVRRDFWNSPRVRGVSSLTLALILWQGAIGWLTVKFDNENWSVAIHLGSALAFMISLIWLWIEIRRDEEDLPNWINFDPLVGVKWRKWIGVLSFSTLITLFSGVYVSTTPGANYGCGVGGMLESWPLCNGQLIQDVDDWELQSQIVHRWLVGVVGVMMAVSSYKIWKECEHGQSGVVLRNWIWASTATYFGNGLLGATYILSWDSGSFSEYLSLAHLMVATVSFTILATAWLGVTIISSSGRAKIIVGP